METEDLQKENEKLKEIVALKSNLISMTAHELRTSAITLKWILKMLMDKDVGEINPEQETLLKKGYESNERSIEMVGEFLAANTNEDATINYKFGEVDVFKLLDDVVSDFLAEAFKHDINIVFTRPTEKIPYLKIDSPKIRIVFQNLIDNAIKYSEKRGEISISARKDGNFIEFTFKDTGIGISQEDREKIFEKFFRSEKAKQKKNIGTGLGLTTTKSIIERHGGKIWFESKENEGTTFYFTLPI